MEYNVHCWMILGYDVDIVADSQEDAIEKAKEIAQDIPLDCWVYSDGGAEIID